MHSWKAVGEFPLLAREHGPKEEVRGGAAQLLVVERRPAMAKDTVGVPGGGRCNPLSFPRADPGARCYAIEP